MKYTITSQATYKSENLGKIFTFYSDDFFKTIFNILKCIERHSDVIKQDVYNVYENDILIYSFTFKNENL
jgi:hypothetical protein